MSKLPLFLAVGFLTIPAFAAEPTALPLRDVTLFSSGVGYFGRTARVTGDAEVELKFRSPQLADILKSLVLLDPQGQIRPVFYSVESSMAARPSERELNLDDASTIGAILRNLQGAQVTVTDVGGTKSGQIVSVSAEVRIIPRTIEAPESRVTEEYLTLFTDKGLSRTSLSEIRSVSFEDKLLNDKMKATLTRRAALLTSQLDDGMRTVKLRFSGKMDREVSVAYLRETPVWKTSYRLILDAKSKPFLQGWAIVENTSDDDWKDVNLSMVSGRPISFIQNLSSPMYVMRPVVETLPGSSLTPQTYGASAALSPTDSLDGRVTRLEARPVPAARVGNSLELLNQARGRNYISNFNSAVQQAAAPVAEGVASTGTPPVQGEEAGELFSYALEAPFSLEKGRAAMIPIVGTNVAGDQVTVISSTNAIGYLTPLNGFFLGNITKMHLPSGPITVFSGGTYAGDALTSNISPGDTRLISYAQDLNLSAKLDRVEDVEEITGVAVFEGNVQVSKAALRKRTYVVRNKDDKAKSLFLIQPEEPEFKLSNPKQPFDKTIDGFRFRFDVKPKETLDYLVQSQQALTETVALSALDVARLNFYAGQKVISDDVKKALLAVAQRRARWSQATAERIAKEVALKDIESDQERIRGNMERLSETSQLRKQYEAKLAAQEPKVEALREEIAKLRDEEAAAEKEFGSYNSKVRAF